MASTVVPSRVLTPKVSKYADKIRLSWRSAVEGILSTAALLKEAESSLTDAEWFDLIGELPFTQMGKTESSILREGLKMVLNQRDFNKREQEMLRQF